MSLEPEDLAAIKRAADLIAGIWSGTAAQAIEAAMLECASDNPTSGVNSFRSWVPDLRSLGEIIISLADREKKRAQR